LTKREREIAVLAAAGKSSKQIAEGMYVSPRTVESHLYRVYVKLGVTDRAGLAAALGLPTS
jgi:DNA-binding CsgD family transcriptional regulator